MPLNFTFTQIVSGVILASLLALYVWGWRRAYISRPRLATPARLFSFSLGIVLLLLAMVGPIDHWSALLLTGRSIQKALICMLAPPLLWLGLPYHILAATWTPAARRRIRLRPLVRRLTHAPAAWLLFVSAFLLWHDPTFVQWALHHPTARLVALWLMLFAALLFWWHVLNTGPRIHRRLPGWIMAFYLLGVEIPNMAAGVTIAFTMHPLYPGYFELHQPGAALPFGYMTDQMTGGAIIWVFGSIVYISAIIGVLYRLFRREDINAPRPLVGWDDAEKVIAPGLEHRLQRERPEVPWQRPTPTSRP